VVGKLLAITGAAGRIGSAVRPFLRERYRLHLVDVRPVVDLDAAETFTQADMRDASDAQRALRGVDAVLHLAGEPSPAKNPFSDSKSSVPPS